MSLRSVHIGPPVVSTGDIQALVAAGADIEVQSDNGGSL